LLIIVVLWIGFTAIRDVLDTCRNWSDTGFYWVKLSRQKDESNAQQANKMAINLPVHSIQSSVLDAGPKITVTPSTPRPGTGSQEGATSVQESPFDVDAYMLQHSRDQTIRYGTSTFKRPIESPPSKPPKTDDRYVMQVYHNIYMGRSISRYR